MFEAKITLDPKFKKDAFRYPDVAAYSITDTLRRARAESKRLLLQRYPLLRKARIKWAQIFRVVAASQNTLVGKLVATSRKIPLAPFVTNKAQTMRQKGIPVASRVALTYEGLMGSSHTLQHAFMFRGGTAVSNPQGNADDERFKTQQLMAVSQLLGVKQIEEPLQKFVPETFSEIFVKKLESMK